MAKKKTALIDTKKIVKNVNNVKNQQRSLVIGFLVLIIVAGSALLLKDEVIVATVNGSPVFRWTLIKELEQSSGKQILESLITEKLVYQEAAEKSVTVSAEEIEKEINDYKDSLSEQGQDLDALLEAQGMSLDSLKSRVELQMLAEKLVADKVEVTDEEVAEYIAQNGDFLPQDKSEEELEDYVKDMLIQQKSTTEIQSWITEIQDKADIKRAI
jgi:parvulin-like peptidyl-prolyl isomerase